MKKSAIIIFIMVSILNAWEVTTHRAIDIEALKIAGEQNLKAFVDNMQISDEDYINEKFEGYSDNKVGGGITYFNYFKTNHSSDGMAEHNLTFDGNIRDYQDLIEAGTMLEDAVWPNAFSFNGRFLNHFYDPQQGGKGLRVGGFLCQSAVVWAKYGAGNAYSYTNAVNYFARGFTEVSLAERTKYQAKMFVSVGHIMHLINDMNVPAHTRSDPHAFHEPFEKYMRGGENGDKPIGFYVKGSTIAHGNYSSNAPSTYSQFDTYMTTEAEYTATHFVSEDTSSSLLSTSNEIHPNSNDVFRTDSQDLGDGVYKSYYISKENGRKLGIHIQSYMRETLAPLMYTGDLASTSVFDGDNSVLEDNAQELIPRAIANAAGFVNYFFRGRMKAEANPCGVTVTNDSDDSLVASPDVVTFGESGRINVYYDQGQDINTAERIKLTEFVLKKSLGKNKKVMIPFVITKEIFDSMPEKKLTLVYTGKIGNEAGVSVTVVDISDIKPIESIKAQAGALKMTLSWTYQCDIDMDLTMTGNDAVVYDIKDVEGVGKEHLVIPSLYDIKPGDHYVFNANGEQLPESQLTEETLAEDPIEIRALLETTKGDYFNVWPVESFASLDLGDFAEVDVKEEIQPEWICPAINDVPGWHRPYNADTGSFQCLYCPAPYSVEWNEPPYNYQKGSYYCKRPRPRVYTGGGGGRTYNACSEEEKKSTCGCVPCEYIVSGLKKRIENGPIAGAKVEIIRAVDADGINPPVLYRGSTTDKEDIFQSGLLEISDDTLATFEDDEYYLVLAQGGKDIDRDDDLVRDSVPTDNNGTIHAIIKGSDLKKLPFRVNILTEAIYQVSGDSIGHNYDAVTLQEKLDDTAQKLINHKLYPGDDNNRINYKDVLLWTPAVDKKALYKPFTTYVEPIIKSLYADEERFDESYHLIYEPYASDVPQLEPLALEIPEGLDDDSVIAQVKTGNKKVFNYIVVQGNFSEYFSIDAEGYIHIAQSHLIEDGNRYRLLMKAVDAVGREGSFVSLTIDVNGKLTQADPTTSKPRFISAETFDILENVPEGTVVAKTHFEDSNQTIVSYALTGQDSSMFTIDNQGVVTVAANADIDYEKSKVYRFLVSAKNDAGNESYPISISISIINQLDTPLFDLVVFEHIEENIPLGTEITTIRTDRVGLGDIEKFEILSPHIPFTIDNNGMMYVSNYIDYEQEKQYDFYAIARTKYGNIYLADDATLDFETKTRYDLGARALNSRGWGNEVHIVINVNNIADELPTLKAFKASVEENATAGTKIGQITVSGLGETTISNFVLAGTGHENFGIDVNGSIYVSQSAQIDYESKESYLLQAVASNGGFSTETEVIIYILNVPDNSPVLKPLTLSIEENANSRTSRRRCRRR